MKDQFSYRDAGVDIDAANEAKQRIKRLARDTFNPNVLTEIGSFGGMFRADGEYDVAGFIVGVVDRARIIDGSRIRPGDVLIGLPSVGLHTNGYSLARKLLFEVAGYQPDSYVEELSCTVAQELLKPHRG